MYVPVYMCVFNFFSETTGPMKPNFMWNQKKDRQGKLIHLIQVICCSSLLSAPGRAGAFSWDLSTILAPESLAFSGALKIKKLKAPLILGPERAVDTNDWCITPLICTTVESIWCVIGTTVGRISCFPLCG